MLSWPIGYGAGPVLLGLPIAVLVYLLFPGAQRPGPRREITLAAGGVLFAISVSATAADAACLGIVAACGWLFIKAAPIRNWWIAGAGILAVILEFWISRQLLPDMELLWGAQVSRTIGLSYIMFRIIHMIVDAQCGDLPSSVSPRQYVAYLLFPPTFLAGPIQRYQDFQTGLASSPPVPSGSSSEAAIPAIIGGYFSFVVLSGLAAWIFAWAQHADAMPATLMRATALLSFAVWLYVSFAGYTRLARGFGVLIGFELPANFDRPWRSSNFLDLWSRWHISLSDWFKLYVFNPLVKQMIATSDRPGLAPWLGIIGYFATFFIMGVWHGVSLRFVLYGLCLGAGVSLNKLFQTLMTRQLGRKAYTVLTRHPAYALASRSIALSYFILALGFFWVPGGLDGLLSWLVAAGVVLAAVMALAVADIWLLPRLPPITGRITAVMCTCQVAAIVVYLLVLHQPVPRLLYEFF